MKRCPQCNLVTDDAVSFCRVDGVRLEESSSGDDSKTVALLPDGSVAPSAMDVWLNGRDKSLSAPAAATTVMDSLRTMSPTGYLFGGRRRWIGMTAILVIVALTLSGSVYYSLSRKKNAVINSLAVLPFININADQQLEYLSDGMTETLIYDLSQLPKLNVKARSSVFRYKGKDVPPHTVGADLNVQAVLNGRIGLLGDVLTLTLELADAQTENVIWSEQYNSKQTDLVSLQSEIARDVSNKLRARLSGADVQMLSKTYTSSAEAYQLYLKGRFHWNKRTAKDLEKAIEYFNQAITLDPNYALAYAGLADAYVVLPLYRTVPSGEDAPKAREAATRALSLDGSLVEAHTALALVNIYENNFAGAELEGKRAIELNPNYATAHHWYGVILYCLGRQEEAQTELKRALEIDPLSLIINVSYGECLLYARRYDDAIAQLNKTLELDAGFAAAHSNLARMYLAKGSYADAVSEFARYQELAGEPQTAALMRESFAKGGWQGFLRRMTGEQRPASLPRYEVVVFYAALGEKEKAFAELNKSYKIFGRILRGDPLLDPLRDDPRFGVLVRNVGFPQ